MASLSAQLLLHHEPTAGPSEPPKPLPASPMLSSKKDPGFSSHCLAWGTGPTLPLTPHISLGRWIKFEEKVEDGGERWSAPHVPALPLHSLFQLRTCLQKGTMLLDLDATNFKEIIGMWIMQRLSPGMGQPPERDRPPGGACRTALMNDSRVPGGAVCYSS